MTGHVFLELREYLFKVIHDGRKKTSWDIKNSLATFKAKNSGQKFLNTRFDTTLSKLINEM